MKKGYLLGCLLVTATFASCIREIDAPVPNERKLSQDEGNAVIAASGFKGIVDVINGHWIQNGSVLLYDDISTNPFTLKISDIQDDGSCIFDGNVNSDATKYYILYPAGRFSGFSEGVTTYDVPYSQTLPSEDATCYTSVHPAGDFSVFKEFHFSSLTSLAKFDLTASGVKSFTLISEDGNALAGNVGISIYKRTVTLSETQAAVELLPAGDSLRIGEYYVELVPGKHSAIKAHLLFTDGLTYDMTLDGPFAFEPGIIAEIGEIHGFNMDLKSLSATEIAFSQAVLEWDISGTPERYSLYVDGEEVTVPSVDVTSVSLSGLSSGEEHTAVLTAYLGNISSSKKVSFTTAGVRQHRNGVGSTYLCIDWDQIERTETDGTSQAYQVQVFADKEMTTTVLDVVPYDYRNRFRVFGNSSYWGRTTALQGGLSCTNILIPTRISVGGLYPSTTYYVRVRTRESVTCNTTHTIVNAFGDSAWSDLVPMTTEPVHTPVSREVIYTGFDDFCCQTDYMNHSPGLVPATAGTVPWDKRAESERTNSVGGTSFYVNNVNGHQSNTFSLSTAQSDVFGMNLLVGNAAGTGSSITGDLEGWSMSNQVRPFMGMAGWTDSATGYLGTPMLSRNLPKSGAECSVGFKVVSRIRPMDTFTGSIDAFIYRAASAAFEANPVASFSNASDFMPYEPTATDSEYLCDYANNIHTLKFKATLYPGDAVQLRFTKGSGANPFFLIDDFLIMAN